MNKSLRDIQSWVSDHYGILVSDDLIEYRVQRIIKTTHLDEASILEALHAKEAEIITAAIDAFTVQESYFFRDTSLFNHLRTKTLPHLVHEKQRKKDLNLRIWSVGCARGEEIYSVAIILHQILHDNPAWKIQLIGSDVNQSALIQAKEGLYDQSSLRKIDDKILHTYFLKEKSGYRLKPLIRDRLCFEYVNIVDISPRIPPCDIILCRNVFIYLNKKTIEAALRCFYDSLVDNGLLFLGPTDLLTYHSHPFKMDIFHDLFQLKKEKITPLPLLSPPHPLLTKNALNPSRVPLIEISEPKVSESALTLRTKGEECIKLGNMDAAYEHLKRAILIDSLDPISQFLLGLVYLDRKKLSSAIRQFQKAVYLKPKFAEAAYHLGLLYLQRDERDKGMKWLKKALLVAASHDENTEVLCSQGTMNALVQAINASITYFQEINHE